MLCVGTLFAQIPQSTLSVAPKDQAEVLACPPGQQNFAGTVSLGTFTGQSNDVDLDTMYLCLGDEVEIIHNGDFNLTGDPDPTTAGGIGYGFYNCAPTITGPDQVTIGADPCLVTNPPPTGLFYVATEGNLNGDILFFNDGNLINIFNMGDPGLFFWTPITFDSLVTVVIPPGNDTVYQVLYENNGPCVNANVDAAIPVVYLNEVSVSNVTTGGGFTGCQGTFDIAGGLPEFDGTTYDVTISLQSNPSVTGALVNGPVSHGETQTFTVPEPGTYDIVVEDGKSCAASFTVNVAACSAVVLQMPNEAALPGDNICVPVTAENFTGVEGIQFSMSYDPAILSFTGTQGYNPNMANLGPTNFNGLGGIIIFQWNDFNPMGTTLPDGAVMFELCFDVIGVIGDCSPLEISGDPTDIEIISMGGLVDFQLEQGQLCVSDNTLNVNISTTDLSCPGADDGTFTVTASDGTLPYQVNWQLLPGGPVQGPGQINAQGGGFTANNLEAGDYLITISDNGPANDFIDTISILEGPTLNVIFTLTPPACNGGTGDITAVLVLDSVTINNPGPEYVFEWSNGVFGDENMGVTSGLYMVTITDTISGCFTDGTTFLPQTPAINIQATTITDATCSGFADGAITIDVTGGTPDPGFDYQITWPFTGQMDMGTTSTITGLASGDYTVEVTDGNGCLETAIITVNDSKELIITATTQTDVSCNGDCDGEIEISASTNGGTSNAYFFNWDPGAPGPINTATTSTVSNLCAGNFSVTLSDDEGCEVDSTFTITEPDVLDVQVLDATDETCTVGNDGTATLGVTGGTPAYTYDWGIVGQTDSTATGLSAGMYTITVTDDNGCVDSVDLNINTPLPPQILSFNNDALLCASSTDGELTVNALPGNAAITDYSWSTGVNGPALNSLSNLTPGTYCVTITAADACETIACADVTAPLPLMEDSVVTSAPLCPGDGGGSISVFVSGGTGPYFFDWSVNAFDGTGNSSIGGATITAGSYFVEVIDDNNCPPILINITLEDPPGIEVDFTAIDSVSCFQNQGVPCDGSATAFAMYDDGTNGNFNFQWPSGEQDLGVMSSTANQLCQGTQTVTVSDGTCNVTADVFIPFPDTLGLASVTIDDVTCNGFSDGEATVLAEGGTAPYSYAWSNAQTGPTAVDLAPGTYAVVITDGNGCSFSTTLPVSEPPPLVAFVDQQNSIDSVTCNGFTDAAISITAQGGNLNISPILNYNWENNIAPPTSNIATNLGAGIYSVTVTDVLGCEDIIDFEVFEPSAVQFELGPINPIPCNGFATTVTVDTAFGGNGFANFWYSFSVDNASPQALQTPIQIFGGGHTIVVFDNSGCTADTTIFVSEPPPILLEYPEVVEVELGDSVSLDPTLLQSQFPILNDSVFWTPTTFLTFGDNFLSPTVTPLESLPYTVTAFDINGCPVVAELFVEVDKNRNVYIPNVFSPNGDGVNDFFQFFSGPGVREIRSLRVFDRWGELVYQVTDLPPSENPDPATGWDGTFRGKLMNPGVYVYIAEVEFLDGEVLLYRGDVTLVR
jgi:gliding motility-associated-like protein